MTSSVSRRKPDFTTPLDFSQGVDEHLLFELLDAAQRVHEVAQLRRMIDDALRSLSPSARFETSLAVYELGVLDNMDLKLYRLSQFESVQKVGDFFEKRKISFDFEQDNYMLLIEKILGSCEELLLLEHFRAALLRGLIELKQSNPTLHESVSQHLLQQDIFRLIATKIKSVRQLKQAS